ncbi:TetR/AcrR family transcriptional regulator [Amycolatopsis sp. NPDC059657]|uniref:TetR/AcrR family transcriptional regulator n=1 Tax=Amycolatopsis sp. NPDC059657 TaxID=3346899 RepID=UPI00366F03F4
MSLPSSGPPARSRSRVASGLPAVTPDGIVDAAMRLTAERGLENWTLRQLASAVDAYPAVIYHHVGDREAVVRAVAERVLAQLPTPDPALGWREWFAELLGGMRTVLRRYPGSARRLALFGPGLKGSERFITAGTALLAEAGFGEEALMAYNSLLCTASQFVSMEDDRNPVDAEEYYAKLYLYAINRTLDGVAHRLGEILAE